MHSPILAFVRLTSFVIFVVSALVVQSVLVLLNLRARFRFPPIIYRGCIAILGVELKTRGQIATARPTLYVANHASYLDILLLGSVINGSFISKAEVAKWPVVGHIAQLTGTVFVQRQARHAKEQRDEIKERLANGERLILFPEGTSGDGNRVLPFKSTLFALAEMNYDHEPLLVQPISVAYTRLDGIPLGRHMRPFFAWHGDMDLAPHAWWLAGLGRLTALVTFHEPVTIDRLKSRKALAEYCHNVIVDGVVGSIYDRPTRQPTAAVTP